MIDTNKIQIRYNYSLGNPGIKSFSRNVSNNDKIHKHNLYEFHHLLNSENIEIHHTFRE